MGRDGNAFCMVGGVAKGGWVLRFWHVTTDIRFVSFKIQRIAVCAVGHVSKKSWAHVTCSWGLFEHNYLLILTSKMLFCAISTSDFSLPCTFHIRQVSKSWGLRYDEVAGDRSRVSTPCTAGSGVHHSCQVLCCRREPHAPRLHCFPLLLCRGCPSATPSCTAQRANALLN